LWPWEVLEVPLARIHVIDVSMYQRICLTIEQYELFKAKRNKWTLFKFVWQWKMKYLISDKKNYNKWNIPATCQTSEKGFMPSTQVLFNLPTNAFFSHTKMNKEFSTPLIYKKDACAFCTHCLSCHGLDWQMRLSKISY